MNFVYLAKKYLGVDCLCHERTYGGLIWPAGAGEKPDYEVFESFQREEDRQARVGKREAQERAEHRRVRHHQIRHAEVEAAKTEEERFRDEEAKIRAEAREQRMKAIEVLERTRTKDEVSECWTEIGKTQEAVNAMAREFLASTDWYVTREQEGGPKVPDDIRQQRAQARADIEHGKTVYANWQVLRAKELPSREEMAEAIRAGGEELERLQKVCQDVAKKYPRPKRGHT